MGVEKNKKVKQSGTEESNNRSDEERNHVTLPSKLTWVRLKSDSSNPALILKGRNQRSTGNQESSQIDAD